MTVFDHEIVRLHLRGASQSQPGLRRPFRSEPEKLTEMCAARPALPAVPPCERVLSTWLTCACLRACVHMCVICATRFDELKRRFMSTDEAAAAAVAAPGAAAGARGGGTKKSK
jgi:hypothetical protein